MLSTMHILHGFNVWDGGSGSIDRLIPTLSRRYKIHQDDYGWRGLLGVRFKNGVTAAEVAEETNRGDVLIGHSNGCEIIKRVSWDAGVPKGALGAVLINPALDENTKFGPALRFILVYHNRYDWIVDLASWMIFHPWGSMGKRGYCNGDLRVRNIPTHDIEPKTRGHSGVFEHPEFWAEHILTELDREKERWNFPLIDVKELVNHWS